MSRIITAKPYTLTGSRQLEDADQMFGILFNNIKRLKTKLGVVDDDESDDASGTGINLTHWKKGPWILDDPASATPDVAIIRPANLIAGTTYNNYSPEGMDTAVGIEQQSTGSASITVTGMKAPPGANQKRMFFFRNDDSSTGIIFKHENAGSTDVNRFRLPSGQDVTVAAGQNLWLYYDADRQRWTAAVTPHQSGGLAGSGVSVANLALTTAQLETLNATPVQIVAAPGSGKINAPLGMWARLVKDAGAWSANGTITPVFSGSTNSLLNTISIALATAGAVDDLRQSAGPVTLNLASFTTGDNQALDMRFTADVNQGGGGGAATLYIGLMYGVLTLS